MASMSPPIVSGGWPLAEHAIEFLRDPIGLLERGRDEHGHVFGLRLGHRPAVVLLGAEHSRSFFRQTDDGLSISGWDALLRQDVRGGLLLFRIT